MILQNFYELAIKKYKGDPEAMSSATMAILDHYTEDPTHNSCPPEKESWCSYNRDGVTDQNTHKSIQNPMPKAVVEVVKP